MKGYWKRDNRDHKMRSIKSQITEEGQRKEVLIASSHSKIKGQKTKPESYRFKTNCMLMLHNFLL